jgi:hypothetical protein
MAQIQIKHIPIDQRFPAKLASGTQANRPLAPEADGDAYYATDTQVLSVGATGAWVEVGAQQAIVSTGTEAARPAVPATNNILYFASDTQSLTVAVAGAWVPVGNTGQAASSQGNAQRALAQVSTQPNGPNRYSRGGPYPILFSKEIIDTSNIWTINQPGRFSVPSGLGGAWKLTFQFWGYVSFEGIREVLEVQVSLYKNRTRLTAIDTFRQAFNYPANYYNENEEVYRITGTFIRVVPALVPNDFIQIYFKFFHKPPYEYEDEDESARTMTLQCNAIMEFVV